MALEKIILKTEGKFDAAHRLTSYKGACSNLHGHTWKVEVKALGYSDQLNKSGILMDFKDIKETWKKFDHAYINDIYQGNPSAENLALYINSELKKKNNKLSYEIKVWESETSYAQVGRI